MERFKEKWGEGRWRKFERGEKDGENLREK